MNSIESLLPPRELAVLRLMCRGLCGKEIAAEIGISESNVASCKTNIRWRAGLPAATSVQLYVWAVENGLVEAPAVKAS